MPDDNSDSGQNYDQVVYYVAPAVLVAAILFCCFRMALVYYMQIRPRRNQQAASARVTPRETEMQSAAGEIPTIYRELFQQIPRPPTYEQTIKNDRRSMSAIETGTTTTSNPVAPDTVIPIEPEAVTAAETSRNVTTRDALRRVQSNVEPTPPANQGPPAYSRRRQSVEALDCQMLTPPYTRDRLPSYEQATSQPESRRPTLHASADLL